MWFSGGAFVVCHNIRVRAFLLQIVNAIKRECFTVKPAEKKNKKGGSAPFGKISLKGLDHCRVKLASGVFYYLLPGEVVVFGFAVGPP